MSEKNSISKENEAYEKYIKFLENSITGYSREESIRDTVYRCGLGVFSMYLHLTELRPLEDYKLWCKLVTGETKVYDFTPHLNKPMFQHLKDRAKFNDVEISEFGVPVWMNADGRIRDTDIGITWILEDGIDVADTISA